MGQEYKLMIRDGIDDMCILFNPDLNVLFCSKNFAQWMILNMLMSQNKIRVMDNHI